MPEGAVFADFVAWIGMICCGRTIHSCEYLASGVAVSSFIFDIKASIF